MLKLRIKTMIFKTFKVRLYVVLRTLSLFIYLFKKKTLLPPFQIIRRFGFSRYVDFTMHLDIHYVQIHSKSNITRKTKRLIIWNGGSNPAIS